MKIRLSGISRSLRYGAAGLLIAVAGGCGGFAVDTPDPPVGAESETRSPECYLTLKVAVGENPASTTIDSRTFYPSENDPFEETVSAWEKIHTLRVIIVRPSGIVEWNRRMNMDPNTGLPLDDNLEFLVHSGEKKRIFLFANEKGADCGWNLDEIKMNNKVDTLRLRSLRLVRPSGGALVTNTVEGGTPVPMSESFLLDLPPNETDADRYRTANLFVTRAAIKFSFCLIAEASYKEAGVMVKNIGIRGIANEEYFLPRDTEYLPGKYDPSTNWQGGREIISFTAPQSGSNSFSGYDFSLPVPVEIKAGLNHTFSPQIYFPESKRRIKEYTSTAAGTQIPVYEDFGVTLLMEGDGTQYLQPVPIGLKEIPRNTHVKINIYLKSTGVSAEAEVLPYTEVVLNPGFGL